MGLSVGELIDILSKAPKDKLVVIESNDGIDCGDVEYVELDHELGGVMLHTTDDVEDKV